MRLILNENQLAILSRNYAAGVLPICKQTGRICLQYRGATVTQPHKWANWGGGMEIGEQPKETATREFFEETGVFSPITLIDSYIDIKDNGFKFYNFIGLVNYEFKPVINKHTVAGEIEIEDYKWVNLNQFKKMIGKSDTHFGLNSLWKNNGKQIEDIIINHCQISDEPTFSIKTK